MEKVFNYLRELGYINVKTSYYSYIDKWMKIWKGKADWLDLKTIDDKNFPLYSLDMGKQVCEDFASIIDSEPYDIKAKKDDKILQKLLKDAKVLEKLSDNLEMMACTGTIGTVTRVKNATLKKVNDDYIIIKNNKTKIKTVDVTAKQLIPLTIEDNEIINCAIVSTHIKKINNELLKVYYLEIHELKEKGYQITNKYFIPGKDIEYKPNGVIETYNTLSDVPLFNICKMKKVNSIEENNGLGISIYGNAIDQLTITDLVYNNFGTDFKLGQKLLIINKKLTRVEQEDYEAEDGNIKVRDKVIYPSEIRKQQFMEVGDSLTSTDQEKPYIHEYNPDLRVGDNKEGVQFALDNLSFKCGFGTRYYSFENGVVNTATEAILSNQDLVNNARKNRKNVNNYLIGICRSLLLCEKMLGNSYIDENQEIYIKDVDGFLEDDESKIKKAQQEYSQGSMSLYTYLTKYKGMTDEEAKEEMKRIKNEDSISFLDEPEENK